jgi:hypothetical protein
MPLAPVNARPWSGGAGLPLAEPGTSEVAYKAVGKDDCESSKDCHHRDAGSGAGGRLWRQRQSVRRHRFRNGRQHSHHRAWRVQLKITRIGPNEHHDAGLHNSIWAARISHVCVESRRSVDRAKSGTRIA